MRYKAIFPKLPNPSPNNPNSSTKDGNGSVEKIVTRKSYVKIRTKDYFYISLDETMGAFRLLADLARQFRVATSDRSLKE